MKKQRAVASWGRAFRDNTISLSSNAWRGWACASDLILCASKGEMLVLAAQLDFPTRVDPSTFGAYSPALQRYFPHILLREDVFLRPVSYN